VVNVAGVRKREPFVVGRLALKVDRYADFWILCGRGEIELLLTIGGFEAGYLWLEKLFRFMSSFRGAIHGFIVEFSREKERSKVIHRISAVVTEGDLKRAKVIDIEEWLKERGLKLSEG
jgi:hypothetical protein